MGNQDDEESLVERVVQMHESWLALIKMEPGSSDSHRPFDHNCWLVPSGP